MRIAREERGEREERSRGRRNEKDVFRARQNGGGGGGRRLGMMWKRRDFTEPDPVVPRFMSWSRWDDTQTLDTSTE